jgi:di/tricarboxylate transporter
MGPQQSDSELSGTQLIGRLAAVTLAAGVIGLLSRYAWGLNTQQSISIAIFLLIILSTLFFWSFRLAIAFLGLPVLILTGTLELECFREHCSLEVILFLVGMMIVVGGLRDLGFFTWIIQGILNMRGMTGRRFVLVAATASALSASAVDEVTRHRRRATRILSAIVPIGPNRLLSPLDGRRQGSAK